MANVEMLLYKKWQAFTRKEAGPTLLFPILHKGKAKVDRVLPIEPGASSNHSNMRTKIVVTLLS